MLSRFYVIFCVFFFLLITISESELLMFDDFEEAKINKKNWTHGIQANKISWKTKNGHLEILPIGGGAGGAAAFGYGSVEFEKFGLQFAQHHIAISYSQRTASPVTSWTWISTR